MERSWRIDVGFLFLWVVDGWFCWGGEARGLLGTAWEAFVGELWVAIF